MTAVAARQLATLVRDEAAARDKVRNLELAFEMAGAELVAAKEAEIAERKPRYRCDEPGASVAWKLLPARNSCCSTPGRLKMMRRSTMPPNK